ncbi:MAG: hypothetical protein ACKO6D_04740 [Rubrivivax sp.]
MSEETWGFAPPPFQSEDALQRLRRELREMGLTEREGVFQRKGVRIARLKLVEGALQAEVVKRPSRSSPEWSPRTLKSGADVRDFAADLKRKLAQWSDTDD